MLPLQVTKPRGNLQPLRGAGLRWRKESSKAVRVPFLLGRHKTNVQPPQHIAAFGSSLALYLLVSTCLRKGERPESSHRISRKNVIVSLCIRTNSSTPRTFTSPVVLHIQAVHLRYQVAQTCIVIIDSRTGKVYRPVR